MGVHKLLPLFAMIFTQFVYSAMFLMSKAAISSGMKPSVFIVYRQALATLALAPFAYFADRKGSPPLTLHVLCKIFIVCSVGMTLSMNLHYAALDYTSATFATAATNTIPSIVFIIAVSSRIESLAITETHGWAKILGTVVGLSGAMVFTFYKGPHLYSGSMAEAHNPIAVSYTKEEWIKGSLLLLGAILTMAIWLVMQAPILKEYPAKLRLMTLQSGIGCIVTTIYGATMERNISYWKLGWNINLLAVAYSGIVVSGNNLLNANLGFGDKRPRLHFNIQPFGANINSHLLNSNISRVSLLGSVLGGAMLIVGLYAFLWGKNKETQSIIKKEVDPSKEEGRSDLIITSKSINEHI